MRRFAFPSRAATLGALLFAVVAPPAAVAANAGASTFDLHAGQELTIPVTIVDGRVVLGAARASKLGAAQPKDGEITVGLAPQKGTLYDTVTAREKTAAPVDFVATGLIGSIKIDEAVICGRLDGPSAARIGSVSWRVSLREFEIGKGAASCP